MKHLPTVRWTNWLKAFICAWFVLVAVLSLPAFAKEAPEFAGKPFDNQTGLTYMGARYYDPVLGRFMGIDPKGVDPENIHSFNRSAYANNNPYKFVDPDGHSPIDVAFLVYDIGKLGVSISTQASVLNYF